MSDTSLKIFHFPQKDGSVIDIDASSYSEARRKHVKVTGNAPGSEDNITVSPAN